MKKLISVFACFLVAVTLVSCYNTRIIYGDVKKDEPLVEVNKIMWTHGFLFGLIPGNNSIIDTKDFAGGANNYVIRTNQSFINALVGGLTCGIYTPTQTTLYIPLKDMSK